MHLLVCVYNSNDHSKVACHATRLYCIRGDVFSFELCTPALLLHVRFKLFIYAVQTNTEIRVRLKLKNGSTS